LLTSQCGQSLSIWKFFNLQKNHFILASLDRALSSLVESGIAKHLANYGQWYLFRPRHVEVVDTRRVLALSDLDFGFVLWLGACFVAFLVFLYEICLSLKVRRVLVKFVGVAEFLRVLVARKSNYHDGW
jgi:hypothetical protein